MQISITRSQEEETDRKGRSKGITFRIAYQLRPNADERAAIERYGLASRYVVGDYNSSFGHTMEKMLAGSSYSASSTDAVLDYQKLVMRAAHNSAALVSQVSAFNGHETVIELDPDAAPESE